MTTTLDLEGLYDAVQEKYSTPHLQRMLSGINANYQRFLAAGGIGESLARVYLSVKMKDPNPAAYGDEAAFKDCACDNGFFHLSNEGRGVVRPCDRCLGRPVVDEHGTATGTHSGASEEPPHASFGEWDESF